MINPILSIIIVNFNSGANLQNTLSVLESYVKFREIEIVLVDGGSNDESQKTIKIKNGMFSKLIIEQDDGIYDAMNKGINVCTGNWIWFINSGDFPIIEPEYLIDFIKYSHHNNSNFIFSDLQINGSSIKQSFSIPYLMKSTINHQSLIYKKEIILKGFDLKYRFCADYAHLLYNINKIKSIKCPRNLCLYDLNGVSSVPDRGVRLTIWKERVISQIKSPLNIFVKSTFVLFSLTAIVVKFILPSFGSIRKTKSKGY